MSNHDFFVLLVAGPIAFLATPFLFAVAVISVTRPDLGFGSVAKESLKRLGELGLNVLYGLLVLSLIVSAWVLLVDLAFRHGWILPKNIAL